MFGETQPSSCEIQVSIQRRHPRPEPGEISQLSASEKKRQSHAQKSWCVVTSILFGGTSKTSVRLDLSSERSPPSSSVRMQQFVVFEADTPQYHSRKRAAKACEKCQKSKKRCHHIFPDRDGGSALPDSHAPVSGRLSSGSVHGDMPDSSRISSPDQAIPPRKRQRMSEEDHASSSSSARFVGDLNPESVLVSQSAHLGGQRHRPVGVWVGTGGESGSKEHERRSRVASPLARNGEVSDHESDIKSHLHQYLVAVGAYHELPLPTRENLIAIYFTSIQPIIPMLEKTSLTKAYTDGTISNFLIQAICLVASKSEEAAPHLRLVESGPVMKPRPFAERIYNGLVAAMNANIEPDRVTCIRILALMSLHCEGAGGADASSMHLLQAVHHAQTAGLQIDSPDRDRENDSLSKLFWSLWSLDKLHASIGGRPIMIFDRDIGISNPTLNSNRRKAPFDIWLELSEMLAKVIDFYRPTARPDSTGWEDDFPAFEDIVGDYLRGDLEASTLALLELFYHTIAILACRSRPSSASTKPSTSTPSYTRQALSALRIQTIISKECPQNLPPLPIVPYAVSLALSVAYRQLRHSRLITHRNRAKSDLSSCCDLLESMSSRWWSASAMARLGRKALQNFDADTHRRQKEATTNRKATPTHPARGAPQRRHWWWEIVELTGPPLLGRRSTASTVPDPTPPTRPLQHGARRTEPRLTNGLRRAAWARWIRRHGRVVWRVSGSGVSDEFLGSVISGGQ